MRNPKKIKELNNYKEKYKIPVACECPECKKIKGWCVAEKYGDSEERLIQKKNIRFYDKVIGIKS